MSNLLPTEWPRHFAARIANGDDRWTLIEGFVAWWYRDQLSLEGNTDAEIDEAERRIGVKLPESLRRWYRLAGKSLSHLSFQDPFVPLDQLEVDLETSSLVVRREAQNVVEWRMRGLKFRNPAIYLYEDDNDRGPYSRSLSDFLLHALIFEGLFSDRHSAYGDYVKGTAEAVMLFCADVHWHPHYWIEGGELFLADGVIAMHEPGANQLWINCRSAAIRDAFIQAVPATWYET